MLSLASLAFDPLRWTSKDWKRFFSYFLKLERDLDEAKTPVLPAWKGELIALSKDFFDKVEKIGVPADSREYQELQRMKGNLRAVTPPIAPEVLKEIEKEMKEMKDRLFSVAELEIRRLVRKFKYLTELLHSNNRKKIKIEIWIEGLNRDIGNVVGKKMVLEHLMEKLDSAKNALSKISTQGAKIASELAETQSNWNELKWSLEPFFHDLERFYRAENRIEEERKTIENWSKNRIEELRAMRR